MPGKLRVAYCVHSLRSDWNNGNAHFLRGLLRSMISLGHEVTIYEQQDSWSAINLSSEAAGERALQQFHVTYPELQVTVYPAAHVADAAYWRKELDGTDIVIVHEWNPPKLAQCLLAIRPDAGFQLLFHDTHHRASSATEQILAFGLDAFDGVLAFGEALRTLYRERFNIGRVWTLHEAADTTVFRPMAHVAKTDDVVWIGNWGDGERSKEICRFLLRPAAALASSRFAVYGVRYPEAGLAALRQAGVHYAGYLPNLDAPITYAAARLTVHIPRQQYTIAMTGIPTIRVFEALACGIPLISAPWEDTEELFRPGDYCSVPNGAAMQQAMRHLLTDKRAAFEQACRGLETVLARHTCMHRAQQLTAICEELLD